MSTLPPRIPATSGRPASLRIGTRRPGTCPHPHTPGAKPRGDCPGRSDCHNRRAALRASAPRVPAAALVAAKLPGPAGSKKLACTKRFHRHHVDARGARAPHGVRNRGSMPQGPNRHAQTRLPEILTGPRISGPAAAQLKVTVSSAIRSPLQRKTIVPVAPLLSQANHSSSTSPEEKPRVTVSVSEGGCAA